MCMPGTPEHDAWLKGPEAYEAFLKAQEQGQGEVQDEDDDFEEDDEED